MTQTEREVEQLKEQEEIRTALRQTAGTKDSIPTPTPARRDRAWLGTYILVLLMLMTLYSLLGSSLIHVDPQYLPTLRNMLMGAFLIVLTATAARAIRVFHDRANRK